MTRKEEYQEKRKKLSELTAHYRKVRNAKAEEAKTTAEALHWLSRTLNSFIVEDYQRQQGEGEFNTFHQWKEKNRTIKKGEKGWPIWGQPLGSRADEEKQSEDQDAENMKYFPLCYLFHESQTAENNEQSKKALIPRINAYA